MDYSWGILEHFLKGCGRIKQIRKDARGNVHANVPCAQKVTYITILVPQAINFGRLVSGPG